MIAAPMAQAELTAMVPEGTIMCISENAIDQVSHDALLGNNLMTMHLLEIKRCMVARKDISPVEVSEISAYSRVVFVGDDEKFEDWYVLSSDLVMVDIK